MLEVYLDPCTVNSRKTLAGLDLLGTKYHYNFVNYFTGEHKSPDYTKINPCATVPAAVDDDLVLTESNAILQYAADLSGESAAYPKDLKKRALVNRWLLWEASVWFPSCYVYLVEYVVKPLLNTKPDEETIQGEAHRWHRLAGILDAQLAKTKWLTGETVTIADIAVASPMHLHGAQKLPLEEHPNLKRWLLDEVENLPCWKKTQSAVDKALLPKTAANGHTEKSVQATLNFTKDLGNKLTELYFYKTNDAKGIHELRNDAHEIAVTDGWDKVDSFSVDNEGFSHHNFETSYDQWEDEEATKAEFYPEVVDFLRDRTPMMLVHCDYTAESGPVRVRQLLPEEAEDLLSRRVAFINVCKPVHRMAEERHLAMFDSTATKPDDFFKLHLRYRDRNGENYVMKHRNGQKWYYFPKMTPDEAILLNTYDSETDGRARFVSHSAFEYATSPKDAPMRESIEIWTIAFF
ncbi:MAG: hypothetical protein Q9167_006135 [Letrouitia subvulpina]